MSRERADGGATDGSGVPPVRADGDAGRQSGGEGDPVALDEVKVKGRALTLYKVKSSAVGTRTDTPLDKVPQSVQVLSRELIEDQAARQVTDLYRSISGISFFSYAGVSLRGFRQENVLYDGFRGDPYADFSVPQLFNIERVEVLKGPSGSLYGAGEAGGIINYVTRKPQASPEHRLTLGLGNEHYRAASVETTGPMGENSRLRYRLGVHADGQKGPRWHADSDDLIADVGLALDVGDTGELLLQYTDLRQKLGGNRLRGVPVDDDGHFLTDTRWNHNEPDDFLDMSARVLLSRFTVSPTPEWTLDAGVRWFENDEHQIYHEPMGLQDRDGDGVEEWMTRQTRNQFRNNDALAFNINAVHRLQTGAIRHQLLLGVDHYRSDASFRAQTAHSADQRRNPGPVPGIDLFRPAYGRSSFNDYGFATLPWRAESTRTVRHGIYLQDEATLSPGWLVLASLRRDGFRDTDRLTDRRTSGHDLSWRLGSTLQVHEGVNAYVSLASGFVPQSAGNQSPAAGGPFDAEQNRQWEAGFKSLLAGGRLTLNMALYRIDRSNIVQATGEVVDGVNQLAALGLVRSKGIETELLADLSDRWVLNLVHAYNDARVVDAGTDGIRNASGGRMVNAPRHKLGLWVRHELPVLRSALGFGLDHTGNRVSLDGQRVRAYTVFDLSWQTFWRDWRFQVNVKNLFDRRYATSGFGKRQGHFPGEPRRLYLQAVCNF